MVRVQIRVQGLVQGVGFRPHVFRIAHELNCSGWVRNDSEGVFIEIQGSKALEFEIDAGKTRRARRGFN